MSTVVALDSIVHYDLAVVPGPAARFGHAINQVTILPTEIDAAQRDFPLLIRRDDGGGLALMALLGLDRDENLFLDGGDRWRAHHVPVLMQKGPFLLGMAGGATAGGDLHVDLDHPAVGGAGSVPLFLPHGGRSPYLEHLLRLFALIHEGATAAPAMLSAWQDAGLLEERTLRVSLDEDRHWNIKGVLLLSPARLAALDGAALARLNAANWLGPAFLVAASLGNLDRIARLKSAREADGTTAAMPA